MILFVCCSACVGECIEVGTSVAEMPMDLDIEVEVMALDKQEMQHLSMDTRYLSLTDYVLMIKKKVSKL